MAGDGYDRGFRARRESVADIEAVGPDADIDIGPVTTGRHRRCGEGAIRPGDEVVVIGQAVERPGNGADPTS